MSLTTSLIDASDLQSGLVFAGTSADIPGVLSDAPVDWKSDPSLRWRLLYVEENSNLAREQSSDFREASNLRGPVFDLLHNVVVYSYRQSDLQDRSSLDTIEPLRIKQC